MIWQKLSISIFLYLVLNVFELWRNMKYAFIFLAERYQQSFYFLGAQRTWNGLLLIALLIVPAPTSKTFDFSVLLLTVVTVYHSTAHIISEKTGWKMWSSFIIIATMKWNECLWKEVLYHGRGLCTFVLLT